MLKEGYNPYKSRLVRGLGAAALALNSACVPPIDIQVRIGDRSPQEASQEVICSAPPDILSGQDDGDNSIFPKGSNFTPKFLENARDIENIWEASRDFPVVLVEPPIFQDTKVRDLPQDIKERVGIQSMVFTAAPDGALGMVFKLSENVCYGSDFQKPATPIPLYIISFNQGKYHRYYSTRQYGTFADLERNKRTPLYEFYADFWDTSLNMPEQTLVLVVQRGLFSTSPDKPEIFPLVFRLSGSNQKI